MYRHGFVEKDIDPSDVHEKVKEFLVNDGFNITSDEHHDQMWEIHAKKSGGRGSYWARSGTWMWS